MRNNPFLQSALSFAMLAAASGGAQAVTVIDQFEGNVTPTFGSLPRLVGGVPDLNNSSVFLNGGHTGPSVIGDRRIQLTRSSGGQATPSIVMQHMGAEGSKYLDMLFTGEATARFQWDGSGGSPIDTTGLGNVDLGESGSVDAIIIEFENFNLNGGATFPSFTFTAYQGGDSSSITVDSASAGADRLVLPFAEFSDPTILSDVGALSFEITSSDTGSSELDLADISTGTTVTAAMSVSLNDDADSSGNVTPNDVLRYTTTISNPADLAGFSASSLAYFDNLPNELSVEPNSLSVSQGGSDITGSVTITEDGSNGLIYIELPNLADGADDIVVSYDARLDSTLAFNRSAISNSAIIRTAGAGVGIQTIDSSNLPSGLSSVTINGARIDVLTYGDNNNGSYDVGSDSLMQGINVEFYRDSDSSGDYSSGDELLLRRASDSNGVVSAAFPHYREFIVRVPMNQGSLQNHALGEPLSGEYALDLDPSGAPNIGASRNFGFNVSSNTDHDADGISASEENAVPSLNGAGNSDGNGDGFADGLQSHVTSLRANGGSNWITVEADHSVRDVITLENVSSSAPSGTLPAGASFPYGLVGFTLSNVAPGSDNVVTLFFPYNGEINNYYKRNSNGQWQAPAGLAIDHINGNTFTRIRFTLTEGDLLDLDSDGNTITDPGGPVIISAASVDNQHAVPALPLGFLLATPLLMLGLAGWRRRKA